MVQVGVARLRHLRQVRDLVPCLGICTVMHVPAAYTASGLATAVARKIISTSVQKTLRQYFQYFLSEHRKFAWESSIVICVPRAKYAYEMVRWHVDLQQTFPKQSHNCNCTPSKCLSAGMRRSGPRGLELMAACDFLRNVRMGQMQVGVLHLATCCMQFRSFGSSNHDMQILIVSMEL